MTTRPPPRTFYNGTSIEAALATRCAGQRAVRSCTHARATPPSAPPPSVFAACNKSNSSRPACAVGPLRPPGAHVYIRSREHTAPGQDRSDALAPVGSPRRTRVRPPPALTRVHCSQDSASPPPTASRLAQLTPALPPTYVRSRYTPPRPEQDTLAAGRVCAPAREQPRGWRAHVHPVLRLAGRGRRLPVGGRRGAAVDVRVRLGVPRQFARVSAGLWRVHLRREAGAPCTTPPHTPAHPRTPRSRAYAPTPLCAPRTTRPTGRAFSSKCRRRRCLSSTARAARSVPTAASRLKSSCSCSCSPWASAACWAAGTPPGRSLQGRARGGHSATTTVATTAAERAHASPRQTLCVRRRR